MRPKSKPVKRTRAPGAGRPPLPASERRVTLAARVDPSTLAALRDLSDARKCSVGSVIDAAVKYVLHNLDPLA